MRSGEPSDVNRSNARTKDNAISERWPLLSSSREAGQVESGNGSHTDDWVHLDGPTLMTTPSSMPQPSCGSSFAQKRASGWSVEKIEPKISFTCANRVAFPFQNNSETMWGGDASFSHAGHAGQACLGPRRVQRLILLLRQLVDDTLLAAKHLSR